MKVSSASMGIWFPLYSLVPSRTPIIECQFEAAGKTSRKKLIHPCVSSPP
jgi:hypothetical protein